MDFSEISLARHDFPVIAFPALYKHQQVKSLLMDTVILFEIVFRLMDIAFKVRCEQQIRPQVILIYCGKAVPVTY